MTDRKKIVERYFSSWIDGDRTRFGEIFSENAVYSECYGPEYRGLGQIVKWFDDWQEQGRVLCWKIKNFYQDGNVCAVEWRFQCVYQNETSEFDGVSLIAFSETDQIVSVKEFQSKAEHYFPYE